jgi:uncharacterized protein
MTLPSFTRDLSLLVAFASLSAAAAPVLGAQDPAPRPLPQIMITAQGEVAVTPDRARISLGVETEGQSAQEASQANAALQTKVMDALRKSGVPNSAIRTTGYNVAPKQEFNPTTRTWRVEGYRVSNIVVVTLDAIDKTGPVIDAALGAGANRVAGISFEIKDASKARERAIQLAVERARREADIAARAAGGQVRGLIELNVNSYEQSPRPMMEMAMSRADASSTPISEGTQNVVVSVTTRWEYGSR